MNKTLTILDPVATDPAGLGWPPSLPVEIALRIAPLPEIRAAYGIEWDEWEELRVNTAFRKAVLEAQEKAQEDGFTYKTKARLQAEALLQTSWALIHEVSTPAAVKADLIKFTTRVAGYDAPKTAGLDGSGGFQIVLNLGDAPRREVQVNPMKTLEAMESPYE